MPDPTRNTARELIKALPDELQYTIERFLHSLGSTASEHTIRQYKRVAAQLTSFLHGDGIPLRDAKASHIEDFFFELGKMSTSTEKNYLSIITSLFDYLIMQGEAQSNPATIYRIIAKKRFKRQQDPDSNVLDESAFSKVLEARRILGEKRHHSPIEIERDIAMLYVLYSTGIRRAELHMLNKNSYDVNTGTLLVRGKGNKVRKVAILVEAEEALKGYLSEVRPLFEPHESEQAMFLSKSDDKKCERVKYEHIGYMVRQTLAAAAVFMGGDLGTHIFRRSHATLIQHRTGNPKLVQSQLGHASVTTTERYIKLADNEHVSQIRDKVGIANLKD